MTTSIESTNEILELLRDNFDHLGTEFGGDGSTRAVDKLITQAQKDGYSSLTEEELQKVINYSIKFAQMQTLQNQVIDLQKMRVTQELLLQQDANNAAQAKMEELVSTPYVPTHVVFSGDDNYLQGVEPEKVVNGDEQKAQG